MQQRRIKQNLLGSLGEEAAAKFYLSQGCKIIARNWRAGRFAEVDLIASHPDGYLIFAEVKTRRLPADSSLASGFDCLNWRKQKKILTAASIFMARRHYIDHPCRFDVIIVNVRPDTAMTLAITFVPDAFSS